MQDNQIAKYPDYLLEFEEIKALAAWQRSAIKGINTPVENMLRRLKLDYILSQGWDDMLNAKLPADRNEGLKKLHRKYPVTTWDILKDYIRIWLPEGIAPTVEYDRDSFTVKVRIKQGEDDPLLRKWTRDVLPCNMVLDFAVEEAS